jgi:hypothetical protein
MTLQVLVNTYRVQKFHLRQKCKLHIIWICVDIHIKNPNLHTNGYLFRVTYTRCRIDTINSPDDRHMAARNM